MSRDDAVLLDILKAARLIMQFKDGLNKAAFLNDTKTQSAILHQIVILGEATKRLSSEFRAKYQEIPWGKITGMRDRLIHEYQRVDLNRVWRTASMDIPQLITLLEPLAPIPEKE